MSNKTSPLLPATRRRLQELGERLRLARLRRKLTAASVAERAGMALMTLRSVERGESGVTIGAYVAVLQVLGLDADIDRVAFDDVLGRQLQDSRLRPPPVAREPAPKFEPSVAPVAPKRASRARAPAASAPTLNASELAQLIAPAPASKRKP